MTEYVTEAIIIDKEPKGETDSRVFLYTEALGLIAANATSARKATSKLAPHLEPLNLALVRLIEKNNFQVTDALKLGGLKKTKAAVMFTQFIKKFFSYGEPDSTLWKTFREDLKSNGRIRMKVMLKDLGFDPDSARCETCNRNVPRYFSTFGYFLCDDCFCNNYDIEGLLDVTAVA